MNKIHTARGIDLLEFRISNDFTHKEVFVPEKYRKVIQPNKSYKVTIKDYDGISVVSRLQPHIPNFLISTPLLKLGIVRVTVDDVPTTTIDTGSSSLRRALRSFTNKLVRHRYNSLGWGISPEMAQERLLLVATAIKLAKEFHNKMNNKSFSNIEQKDYDAIVKKALKKLDY